MNFLAVNPLTMDRNVDGKNATFYDYSKVVDRYIKHELYKKDGYFDRNIAEVHIYIESGLVTYINESALISSSQVMGQLGGTIGLYLGMCIISLVEFVELCCILVYIIIRRCIHRVSKDEAKEMVGFCQFCINLFQYEAWKQQKFQNDETKEDRTIEKLVKTVKQLKSHMELANEREHRREQESRESKINIDQLRREIAALKSVRYDPRGEFKEEKHQRNRGSYESGSMKRKSAYQRM